MRAMHAWRVHEVGPYREVLRWEEVPDPAPPDDGVVVEVRAAGLNFPDLLVIAGNYQVKAPLPFTPGIEACGVVVEAGPGSTWKPGDRVIAHHHARWGAFAERMTAPDGDCFAVPDAMTDAHAAALLVIYQTSYFGLVYRAGLQAGETLVVHGGAGGVGTSAIQIGKALGATVIATAGTDDKLEVCRRAGADHVINYREEDFVERVRAITDGRGADVIYDPVGGDVFDASTKCLAFSGRLLVIGFASGRIPSIACNRVLLKNISIVGLHWNNYRFHEPGKFHECHERLCELYARGAIEPVIYRDYPMTELPEALAAIEGRASYGKVIVSPR